MNEKQWATFFDLLGRIVNMPNQTADEKAGQVIENAKTYAAETDLGEFLSWELATD